MVLAATDMPFAWTTDLRDYDGCPVVQKRLQPALHLCQRELPFVGVPHRQLIAAGQPAGRLARRRHELPVHQRACFAPDEHVQNPHHN